MRLAIISNEAPRATRAIGCNLPLGAIAEELDRTGQGASVSVAYQSSNQIKSKPEIKVGKRKLINQSIIIIELDRSRLVW